MYFEDFHIGQTWPVDPFVITDEQVIDFASKYDPLPIHLDENYAKTTRFGSIIASGVMTFMLFWVQFLKQHNPLGDELVAGMRNNMQWPAPVRSGDRLRGEVVVVDLTRRNAHYGIVEIELKAYNQDGLHVMSGGAEILFKTLGSR